MGTNKNKDIRTKIKKIVSLIIPSALGGVLGYSMVNRSELAQGGFLDFLSAIAILIVTFAVQIVFHEVGHLICGLLSGYKFISFRIGSLTIVKENGRYSIKKFNIAGTGGQCLMMPKEEDYKKNPFILYHLGGVLMNILLAIICFGLLKTTDGNKYLNQILLCMIATGVIAFILNGIPMKISGIANDAYNLISMLKNDMVRYAFFIQLKVNGLMTNGMRAKDIPKEWFELDDKADFSNPLVTSIKCVEAAYYHDRLEFYKAKDCYEFLLNYRPKIVQLYINEINCELLFYEIIGEKDKDKIERLYTKELKAYINASKSHVSKMRLLYSYSLIIDEDIEESKNILEKIKNMEKTYPIKGDYEGELEIVEFIQSKFATL